MSAEQLQERHEALLRDALRSTTGNAELDALFNASIYGAVAGRPRDELIYRMETGPEQVALDLHLEGPGVTEHATRAVDFAKFVSALEEAVRATAKRVAGKSRYRSSLLIEGVQPGSVRLVLRVPDAPKPKAATGMDTIVDVATADSQALRTVAGVLTAASAEDDPDADAMLAFTDQLPPQARVRLRTAVVTANQAGWELEGTVEQRHREPETVRLTARGAQRLDAALQRELAEPRRLTTQGRIDGFKYSLSTMWFIAPGSPRPFSVAVPTPALLDEVAQLAAEHQEVEATFDEFQSVSPDGTAGRVSRSLVAVRRAPLSRPPGTQSALDA